MAFLSAVLPTWSLCATWGTDTTRVHLEWVRDDSISKASDGSVTS